MRVEIYYEAPTEVFELNEDQEALWIEYNEAVDKARSVRVASGFSPEASEAFRKADLAYEEFLVSIELFTDYPDLEIEEITEW